MSHKPERDESLWMLTLSPLIWAIHFLASYVTAAVWCAKFAGESRSLGNVPGLIGIYTLLALAGILVTGWRGYRHHRHRRHDSPLDADSPLSRHRFLGYAILLLSVLSGVATMFVSVVVVFFRSCD